MNLRTYMRFISFLGILLSVTACKQDVQTVPLFGLSVNEQTGPEKIIVSSTPVILKVKASKVLSEGSVEFYDGATLVCVDTKGDLLENPDRIEYICSLNVTVADNGLHSYKAILSITNSEGQLQKSNVGPVEAFVEVK